MNQNKINVWGHEIPTPQSVILDEEMASSIGRLLSRVLSLIGFDHVGVERFHTLAIEKAKRHLGGSLVAYEQDLKAELANQIVPNKMEEALADRANIVYREIKPLLLGDSLLDIGCGNGLIADLAKNFFKQIQLLDVVRYVSKGLALPFVLYSEGSPLPIDRTYDTVLVLTVLHHSNDPLGLLKLAWGATNKRLIIIESVVGVHQKEVSANYELVGASERNQIAYAAFVDWFYNRVLHDDVPVPYNFTTPERWHSTFQEQGMHLSETIHFGQDIDIGPEYHILFLLEK